MIGFSQANDLSAMFPLNEFRERSMTNSSNQTSSTNDFCDEIDEIMKHEQEDDISLDNPLSVNPLDLDLDSISDLLENPQSSSNFTNTLNLNNISPTTLQNTNTNLPTITRTTSLGIGPKFTVLSLNHNQFPQIMQSNNSHLPSYIQSQDNSTLNTSRPFDLSNNTNGSLDVKRFRSASMNDGPSLLQQHHNKLDTQFFDPYRFKSTNYINPPPYQGKPASPLDTSANQAWAFAGPPRPASNSFSEIENQQQQIRLNNSSNVVYRNPTRFLNNHSYPQQTLFSIHQSSNENLDLSRKRPLSLADYPVEEIKDDPSSPAGTIEHQSEADLWSDIDQNSSDPFHDHDHTSDDETTKSSFDCTKSYERSSSPPRFWKYNVQSKGPKTKRILYLKERDPHLHREFSDPVYQIKLTQTNGQTFNKLRKGDGNDVTPNPTKLYQLGKQIRDLLQNPSSVYHGIYNVEHHHNANDTMEAKKEKNKLASKTCRLRKKAQHEANKLKLQGLNEEHKCLMDIISSIKLIILKRYEHNQLNSPQQSIEAVLDQIIATKYSQVVAGNTDGFVEATINELERFYSQNKA